MPDVDPTVIAVIETLKAQRNAAMDQIAAQAAVIQAAHTQIGDLQTQVKEAVAEGEKLRADTAIPPAPDAPVTAEVPEPPVKAADFYRAAPGGGKR